MSNPVYPQGASSIIPIEHRCGCGKLLLKGFISSSEFEIKCRNCHAVNSIGKVHNNPPDLSYSILFNLDANIIDVSDSAAQILGYPKEKISLMKIQDIFPLLKISTYTHLSSIANFLDTEPFAFDTLCQDKDGKFIPISVKARYIKNYKGFDTLALFTCSPRPNTNTTTIAHNDCKFVSRINTQGIYTYVSATLATLLDYPPIEMLGKSIFDFYPKKEQKKIKELFFQHSLTPVSFKLPVHNMVCKNTDILNFESYLALDLNDRGQKRGFQIMSWLIP